MKQKDDFIKSVVKDIEEIKTQARQQTSQEIFKDYLNLLYQLSLLLIINTQLIQVIQLKTLLLIFSF